MRKPYSNPSVLLVATLLLVAALPYFLHERTGTGTAAAATTASAPTVTVNDLLAAGFTDVRVQAPTAGAFLPPNSYFRTRESVIGTHPEWGDTANLVAVFIGPSYDPTWSYNQGLTETLDLAGRAQVRFSRPGYYIVVTGPDQTKVTALAQLLQKK